MSADLVPAVLTAAVGLLGGAGFTTWMSRKKVGADTGQVIVKTANELLQDVYTELRRVQGEAKELRARVDTLTARQARADNEREELRDVLATHAAWDHQVIEHLRDCGHIDIAEAPPLTTRPRSA